MSDDFDSNDEAQDDSNERHRDLEQEKIPETEVDDIDLLIARKKTLEPQKSEKPAKYDIKAIKKAQKKNDRTKQVKEALKYGKKHGSEKELTTQYRKPFLKRVKDGLNKLLAFKMHSVRAKGDQAGIFDNQTEKDGKRRLKFDGSMGDQTVIEKFTTKVNGVTVSGKITTKVGDDGVDIEQIHIDKAKIGRNKIDPKSLGGLSHDAILNSIQRGGGLER